MKATAIGLPNGTFAVVKELPQVQNGFGLPLGFTTDEATRAVQLLLSDQQPSVPVEGPLARATTMELMEEIYRRHNNCLLIIEHVSEGTVDPAVTVKVGRLLPRALGLAGFADVVIREKIRQTSSIVQGLDR